MQKKIALVTGANRGIGFAVVKALANQADTSVWLGARDLELGKKAADQIKGDVKVVGLDVTQPQDILLAQETIFAKEGRGIDILINNAGILVRGDHVLTGTEENFRATFETHVMGAYHLIRAFVPDMIKQNYGRIVNLSSGWGSFTDGLNGPFAYSISKAALNALTLILSHELSPHVKVNAITPGWVKTQMGGEAAPRTPEEAAESIIWLATLPDDGPTGEFFRDKQRIPW
jgi:NAD(P)-dependent dehydrogenase (short-subunit alcohol dehydrogenase family)